ncbi:MAG: hypothetical protein NXI24_12550 [bacterium]|nr:hypothetical protein [bacterium]
MQKKLFLILLVAGFVLAAATFAGAGCVTEHPRRAVVIEGQRIFAPRGFLGRWIRADRPDQGLAFQLPPGMALAIVSSAREPEAYDIIRTIERPDGTVSFRIQPRGTSGRAVERHFRLAGAAGEDSERLFEVFPGEIREIEYRRVK